MFCAVPAVWAFRPVMTSFAAGPGVTVIVFGPPVICVPPIVAPMTGVPGVFGAV